MDSHKKGKRKALIIGVSEYDKLPPLAFCNNDAISMAEVLSSLGYEVTDYTKLIGNVQWQNMRDAIIEYFNHPDLRRDDTVVFYYSGHGVLDVDGDGYFATSEIDPYLPHRRGFSFDELRKIMQGSISSQKVAILDCCYSGSAKITKGSEDEIAKLGVFAVNRVSKTLIEGEGICLLASSQSYQEAYKLEEQDHSLFTYFLLEGLKGDKDAVDGEGYVTVDSLSNYVYDKITQLPEDKRPKQRPQRKIEASGNIILVYHLKFANLNKNPAISIDLSSVIEKGLELIDKKDYQSALQYYEGITQNPSLAQAWDNKGLALHNLDKNEEAIRCFDVCIELDPTNANGWEHKAVCLNNTGKNEEALTCFAKSIVFTKPTDSNLDKCNRWFGKGICLEKEGLEADALACYNKSIELYPKAEIALCKKGGILLNRKEYSEAEKYFDKSLAINPEFPLALLGKGHLIQAQEKYSESISCYEKAIKYAHKYKIISNPDSIHASMASSLISLKKYEAALESLNNALNINPKNVEVLTLKGLMLQNIMQRYDEALQCYDSVLTLDPNNTDVMSRKQKLLEMNNVNINWNEVINRQAYGIGKYDLGIVETVEADHIVTRRGIVNKSKFSLPIYLVERYDAHKLWFKITEEEAQQFRR